MVAAGEDSTQAEYDDQEEGSTEGEPKRRARCVDVGWRKILALHHLRLVLFLLSCVFGGGREEEEEER